MNTIEPLLTLLAHAERERDLAQAEAQRTAQELASAQAQVKQLQDYRRDYELRWSEQFSRSGGIDIVQCYQGFITRLSLAIEQQERLALHAAQRSHRAATQLHEHGLRLASVRKLIERRSHEVRRAGDRREQKLGDELAARAAWRKGVTDDLLSAI